MRRPRLFAPTDFAQSRLVLAAASTARRRLRSALGLLLAAALGAGGLFAWMTQQQSQLPSGAAAAAAAEAALRHDLEQTQLQLRVAEARGHELERQVDGLNQQLRAAQEELAFFRKARDASKSR